MSIMSRSPGYLRSCRQKWYGMEKTSLWVRGSSCVWLEPCCATPRSVCLSIPQNLSVSLPVSAYLSDCPAVLSSVCLFKADIHLVLDIVPLYIKVFFCVMYNTEEAPISRGLLSTHTSSISGLRSSSWTKPQRPSMLRPTPWSRLPSERRSSPAPPSPSLTASTPCCRPTASWSWSKDRWEIYSVYIHRCTTIHDVHRHINTVMEADLVMDQGQVIYEYTYNHTHIHTKVTFQSSVCLPGGGVWQPGCVETQSRLSVQLPPGSCKHNQRLMHTTIIKAHNHHKDTGNTRNTHTSYRHATIT